MKCSRFGTIVCCEIIRDKRTGNSLNYAFIEFSSEKECEAAYLKMDNVLIDDRRIHVDFSQSVSKTHTWKKKEKPPVVHEKCFATPKEKEDGWLCKGYGNRRRA